LPLIFRPNAIFWAMVILVKRAYFWNTVLSCRLLGASSVIFFPSKMTFPVSGDSKPPRIRRRVVFPQPLGPRRVRNSFSRIYRFRSSRTRLSPKDFEIFTISINLCDMVVLPYHLFLSLETGRRADPDDGGASTVWGLYIMLGMWGEVKRFPFFGSVDLFPDMDLNGTF